MVWKELQYSCISLQIAAPRRPSRHRPWFCTHFIQSTPVFLYSGTDPYPHRALLTTDLCLSLSIPVYPTPATGPTSLPFDSLFGISLTILLLPVLAKFTEDGKRRIITTTKKGENVSLSKENHQLKWGEWRERLRQQQEIRKPRVDLAKNSGRHVRKNKSLHVIV